MTAYDRRRRISAWSGLAGEWSLFVVARASRSSATLCFSCNGLKKMSIEPWRKAAYELLPTFRDGVESAEDVETLWIELWDCEVSGINDERITEEHISSLFRFASWCLLSGDEKCQNAAIVHFYEMLPTNARIRSNLQKYLSVEDFLGLKNLFEYHLSKEEHVKSLKSLCTRQHRRKRRALRLRAKHNTRLERTRR
jgi:hypothetical protein